MGRQRPATPALVHSTGVPVDKKSADYGKTASFFAIGVGLTGVITYVYFFIASHVLSRADYGQITILWSAVFILISALYRPVEQLLSRHISEHRAMGEEIGGAMRVAALIQLGLAMIFAVLALALRGPLQDRLLEGNETLYWIFFSAVLFYAASYFARGYLAGTGRFGAFAAMILSESVFRTLFAVLVAISVLSGQSAVAIGIVAAPSLSLLIVPLAFAQRSRAAAPARTERKMGSNTFSMRRGAGFTGAVFLIMLSEQAFLNAGPLIFLGLQGASASGYIFNVLMIARAPLQLFQAVSTSILPHLTSLNTSPEPDSEREFHRTVQFVLLGIAIFVVIAAVVVLIAGPKLMQLAFSSKFSYDRLGLLIVTCGMGLYLASVTINQACIAQGQVRRAALRWIVCAGAFVAWIFVPLVSNEAKRVEVGFLLMAGILLAALYAIYRRPHERGGDVPRTGSPEELEVRLASIDDNV